MQSCASRHAVRHAASSQVYGAQSSAESPARPSIRSSRQSGPSKHCFVLESQRAFVGHWSSDVHSVGHAGLVPSHAYGAQRGSPDERAVRSVHVPAVAAHVSQGASHDRSQHTPCEHVPSRQSAVVEQGPPRLLRHFDVSSQVRSPLQPLTSGADTTGAHVPGVAEHDSHGWSHARSQQNPSAHDREAQSADITHAALVGLPEVTMRARTRIVPKPDA
jgi:hypothetical protein